LNLNKSKVLSQWPPNENYVKIRRAALGCGGEFPDLFTEKF